VRLPWPMRPRELAFTLSFLPAGAAGVVLIRVVAPLLPTGPFRLLMIPLLLVPFMLVMVIWGSYRPGDAEMRRHAVEEGKAGIAGREPWPDSTS